MNPQNYQDPYSTPRSVVSGHAVSHEKPRHSVLGIISFIASSAGSLLLFVLVVWAAALLIKNPNFFDADPDSLVLLIGALVWFSCGLLLLGFLLGIIGVLQKNTRKIFGILGIAFSCFFTMIFGGLVLLGL